MSDDNTGFNVVPARYQTEGGREAIDIIRDSMSDEEFALYCRGQALKYALREGKKGADDADKARWYTMMFHHVRGDGPDPRAGRSDFTGYVRARRPDHLERRRIDVLDHGFVRLVETWGQGDTRLAEAGIIEAARQSTQGSFRGWARDAQLLRYLHEHKHSTPFEFAGMVIEVRAPIFVFREWHRHRTQCLHPDTMVEFSRPCDSKAYPMRIEDVWRKWQPTTRTDRPQRQVNALGPRKRLQAMRVRCLNEAQGEFTTTRILGVIRNDPKPMVRVTMLSGRRLTATRAHKVYTDKGWLPLGEAILQQARIAMTGTTRGNAEGQGAPEVDEATETWKPVRGWEILYEVSDHGRVRRKGKDPRKLTRAKTGYNVCNLNRPGEQKNVAVHRLVLEAFVRPSAPGEEARHLNHNRQDNRLNNLAWGTSADNSADTLSADRHQRLVPVYEPIVSVEEVGEHVTYDLAVEGPWHNFSAGGFVVHNSYSEMSARYAPLPDLDYLPTWEEVYRRSHERDQANKQAGVVDGAPPITKSAALRFVMNLRDIYDDFRVEYVGALAEGVPKELARLGMPVGRYSQMRASANLRNWLAFLTLRQAPEAQWEIQQYAHAVGELVREAFPQTARLFYGEDHDR
jgi:thymidylate synthase (FAD)